MPNFGLLTNGRHTILDQDIFHVVEVEKIRAEIQVVNNLQAEIIARSEIRAEVHTVSNIEARIVSRC